MEVASAGDPNILCMLCSKAIKNPIRATCCQKSFCESCISNYCGENSRCPNCNDEDKFDLAVQSKDSRIVELEDLAKSQREKIERLERQKKVFKKELQSLRRHRMFLVVLLGVLSGLYLATGGNKPEPVPTIIPTEVTTPRIKAEVGEYVTVKDLEYSWQFDIEDYWRFQLFATMVQKVNETILVSFRGRCIKCAKLKTNSLRASVIVQVFNPSGYDHHVSRMDIVLELKTFDESWYTSQNYVLMHLTGDNKKFYAGINDSFKIRILNIEVGANEKLPLHFSMCHVIHYQKNDHLQWYTFPFYLSGYKFMIYIYANGQGDSKGKALKFTVYRMNGEHDENLPAKNIWSKQIVAKIRKKGGGHTQKRLTVTGKAGEIVDEGIEVVFQKNHRFSQDGYRSEHGVSFEIQHHPDLEKYIDDDCFIFDIVADSQPFYAV